jgi:hypothetical protein
VLADPTIADEQVGGLLRVRIGMSRLRRDHGKLAMLESSYSYLRQFTPDVAATRTAGEFISVGFSAVGPYSPTRSKSR